MASDTKWDKMRHAIANDDRQEIAAQFYGTKYIVSLRDVNEIAMTMEPCPQRDMIVHMFMMDAIRRSDEGDRMALMNHMRRGGTVPRADILFALVESNNSHYRSDSVDLFVRMVNAVTDVNWVDQSGCTVLHRFVWNNGMTVEMVVALLSKGLDPNIKDDVGDTVAHKLCKYWARSVDSQMKMRALIVGRIDLDIRNNSGATASEFLDASCLVQFEAAMKEVMSDLVANGDIV